MNFGTNDRFVLRSPVLNSRISDPKPLIAIRSVEAAIHSLICERLGVVNVV